MVAWFVYGHLYPAGQDTQSDWPSSENVPSSQDVKIPLEVQDDPAGQGVHKFWKPTEYVPSGHEILVF